MGWKMQEIQRLRKEKRYAEAEALSKNTAARFDRPDIASPNNDYVVQKGESWFSIAQNRLSGASASQVAAYAQALANANGGMGVLRGGAHIRLPGAVVERDAAPTGAFWDAAMAQSALGGYKPAIDALPGGGAGLRTPGGIPVRAPGTGAESIGNIGSRPSPAAFTGDIMRNVSGGRDLQTGAGGVYTPRAPIDVTRPTGRDEPINASNPYNLPTATGVDEPRSLLSIGGLNILNPADVARNLRLATGNKIQFGQQPSAMFPGPRPTPSQKPVGGQTSSSAQSAVSSPEIAAEFYALSLSQANENPQSGSAPTFIPAAVVTSPDFANFWNTPAGKYYIKQPDGSAAVNLEMIATSQAADLFGIVTGAIEGGGATVSIDELRNTIYAYNRSKSDPKGVSPYRPRRGGTGGGGGNTFVPNYDNYYQPSGRDYSPDYSPPNTNWRIGFG